VDRVGWIYQHRNLLCCGQKLAQECEPFCIYFSGKKIEAGRIAGRPGEAGDEAELDRVFGSNECDWYRLSRCLGGHGGYAPGRSDHTDLPTSQVGGQFRELIESARQPIVDRNVLAFDPAVFGKATAEGVQ